MYIILKVAETPILAPRTKDIMAILELEISDTMQIIPMIDIEKKIANVGFNPIFS